MNPDETMQEIAEWMDTTAMRLGELKRWGGGWKLDGHVNTNDETARHYITGWLQEWFQAKDDNCFIIYMSSKLVPKTEKQWEIQDEDESTLHSGDTLLEVLWKHYHFCNIYNWEGTLK